MRREDLSADEASGGAGSLRAADNLGESPRRPSEADAEGNGAEGNGAESFGESPRRCPSVAVVGGGAEAAAGTPA